MGTGDVFDAGTGIADTVMDDTDDDDPARDGGRDTEMEDCDGSLPSVAPRLCLTTIDINGDSVSMCEITATAATGLEIFSGPNYPWTKAMTEEGFKMFDHMDESNNRTTTNPPVWEEVKGKLVTGEVSAVHVGITCGPVSKFSRQINCTPEQFQSNLQDLRELLATILPTLEIHMQRGGTCTFENPFDSGLWTLDTFVEFMTRNGMHFTRTDMCAHGLAAKKPTLIASNLDHNAMDEMSRARCGHGRTRHEKGLHGYVRDEHGVLVAATALAAEYTPAFARVLARAHRRHHESRRLLRFNTLDTMVNANIGDDNSTSMAAATTRTLTVTNGENVIDTAAEKHCVNDGGNWRALQVTSTINCAGYDGAATVKEMGLAVTLATSSTGVRVLLEAEQAVFHGSQGLATLLCPTALTNAGWKVNMDFDAAAGTITNGQVTIDISVQGSAMGFQSDTPTDEDLNTLPRHVISLRHFNKARVLKELSTMESQGDDTAANLNSATTGCSRETAQAGPVAAGDHRVRATDGRDHRLQVTAESA